jgi:hypothetical protein
MHAKLKTEGKAAAVTDIRVYFPGTVVDRTMRWWLDQPSPEPGQMAARVAEIMGEEEVTAKETKDGIVRWKSPTDKQEVLETCIECVTRLEPILYQVAIPYDYEPALRFRVPMVIPYLDGMPQRIWLVGEIDLLTGKEDPVEGRWHEIWDLKMTKDNGYWRKSVGQLLFYDLAVRIMAGHYPMQSGLIQPMCTERKLTFLFTEEERRELLTHVMRYCSAVWSGSQRPNPSPGLCGRCDTRHACPIYALAPGSHRAPWPVVQA